MIQSCGSYVGLTLLSNPQHVTGAVGGLLLPNESTTSPPNTTTNSPTPFQQLPQQHTLSAFSSTTLSSQQQQLINNNNNNNLGVHHHHLIFPPNSSATSASATTTSPTPFQNNNNNNSLMLSQVSPPQPVAESTQHEFQNNKIRTLQMMIDKEETRLKANRNKWNDNEKSEVSHIIDDLRRKLATEIQQFNHSTIQNNVISNIFTDNQQSVVSSPPIRSQIITVDSDYEDNVSGPSGGGDTSDYMLPIDSLVMNIGGDDINNNNNSNIVINSNNNNNNNSTLSSKSPPSKSSSFLLGKIPGKSSHSSSSKHNRDSKYFNIVAASNIIAAPLNLGASFVGVGGSSGSGVVQQSTVNFDNIHQHSLRFARYLIINQGILPHAMLFYVVGKHIFPSVVAHATRMVVDHYGSRNTTADTVGLRQLITRWGYSILATWAVKDSPLFFLEFSQEMLIAFDRDLESFTKTVSASNNNTSTVLAPNPFEPFLERAREIVIKQMAEFQAAVHVKPELLTSSVKADLQATIELLLLVGSSAGANLSAAVAAAGVSSTNSSSVSSASGTSAISMLSSSIVPSSVLGSSSSSNSSNTPKLDLRDVDNTFDQFIIHAHGSSGSVSTMAIITSLLTIGHYLFNISSKHLLLTDVQNCLSLLTSTTTTTTSAPANMDTVASNTGSSGSPITIGTQMVLSNVLNQTSTTSNILNPVLKLSTESSSFNQSHNSSSMNTSSSKKSNNHKRNVSLPSQSNKPSVLNGSGSANPNVGGEPLLHHPMLTLPPGGISEGGHYFVAFNEMTKVEFCSGCYHSLWGDLNNHRCAKCLMFVHSWCLKACAAVNSCENFDHQNLVFLSSNAIGPGSGVQLRSSTSTRETGGGTRGGKKAPRTKSEKKTSMIELLTGKMAFQRPTSTAATSSLLSDNNNLNRSYCSLSSSSFDFSSSSSSDLEDESFSGALDQKPHHPPSEDYYHRQLFAGGDRKHSTSGIVSPITAASKKTTITTANSRQVPPVNRSGSFNQRVFY